MAAPAVVRMAAGSATGSGIWSAETDLTNGTGSSVVSTTSYVNPTLDPFPAPQAVYQTGRTGDFTYTITSLVPGATYPVNLHFAEFQATAAGQRQFDVSLNGTPVLTNFDIFASAGGEFMALERAFTATADATGTLTIQFSNGAAGSPLVSAIEVLPPVTPAPTLNTGVYTLTSAASGFNLDDDNVTASGSGVIQYPVGAANTNQQWQINKLPNGSYALLNVSNGLALDTGGLNASGSALVETTTAQTAPTATQTWTLTPNGDGSYRISSAATGLYMDSGAGSSGGGVLQAAASGATSQNWTIAPVQIGAATPFTSYEGEWGQLGNGATVISQLVPQPTEFVTPAIEASGRAYAHLVGTGANVQWTNNTNQAVTAINVRYSIPDAPTGYGINATLDLYVNGQFRQALPMTSAQTWTYETDANYFGSIETPATGESAFMYWDEVHAFISGAPVQPGDTISLQIDAQNTASYYDIDVIDLEAPPPPLSQPANSISITSMGVVANDPTKESANTTAFQNAINAAVNAGESVWIPPGTYYLSSQLTANGVTIQGAGMWYSTLYWDTSATSYSGNNQITGTGATTLANFMMDSNSVRERHKYGINLHGSNWLINSVWLQHAGPSIWVDGANGWVMNNRITYSFADGINLNNGSGATGNNTGNNLVAFNNFVRGTGDDGIAVNDAATNPGYPSAIFVQMQNPAVVQNTVVAPWWANDLGIYGGINILEANNFLSGGSRQNAMDIGPFYPIGGKLESGYIQGNITFQAGGKHKGAVPKPSISLGVGANWNYDDTQTTNVVLRGDNDINATFMSIQLISQQNGFLSNDTFNSPGLDGIDISSGALGYAAFYNNNVLNVVPPNSPFKDSATGFSAPGSGNNGFTPQ